VALLYLYVQLGLYCSTPKAYRKSRDDYDFSEFAVGKSYFDMVVCTAYNRAGVSHPGVYPPHAALVMVQ
jgi:hypothetical protein